LHSIKHKTVYLTLPTGAKLKHEESAIGLGTLVIIVLLFILLR